MNPTRILASLALLILLHSTSARADFLNWTYSTTPSVPGVSSGGTVALTDFTNQAGGTSIPVIAYVTSSSSTSPQTFNPANSTYTLHLSITDNTTHDTGSLTFTGSVGGTLTATTSTLTNTFVPSPNTLTLDGHIYTVTIPSVALAPPTSPQQNIVASVSISNVTVKGVPEPSGLLLAGLGIPFLFVRLRRFTS